MAETVVFSSYRRPDLPPQRQAMAEIMPSPATKADRPALEIGIDLEAAFEEHVAGSSGSSQSNEAREDGADLEWADLSSVSVDYDQLGLAHPGIITLQANLPGSPSVSLEADTAGIYRPATSIPVVWSEYLFDHAKQTRSGIAAGCRILTARGEVEVEKLVPGDAVMALRGPALLPISWIGRSVTAVPPIRIEPGALGPGIPRRILCVGPDQAVFLDPGPVAASTLVNGTTIREDEEVPTDLFHIDVGRAEVIFAEGLALSSSDGVSTRR